MSSLKYFEKKIYNLRDLVESFENTTKSTDETFKVQKIKLILVYERLP